MISWLVRGILVGALIISVAACGEVLWRAQQDVSRATDAIVIMGAAQFDGTPQPVFENRLRHAADVWFQQGGTLITVGGKRDGDRFTEADSGRRYLIAQGVSDDAVISVPTGKDTWESMVAVAEVMQDRGMDSATVVSDAAHVARSRMKLLHLGVERVEVSPTVTGPGSRLSSRYITRETLAIMRFWVSRDWFRDGSQADAA
jgi:uncharacterized SAM-binding protein YcdF (DUF218 family)